MFTGIIEEVGTLLATRKASKSESLTIEAPYVLQDAKVGDSIAVNGICLTATSISGNTFTADVMAETMRRTSLGTLHTGSKSIWNVRWRQVDASVGISYPDISMALERSQIWSGKKMQSG